MERKRAYLYFQYDSQLLKERESISIEKNYTYLKFSVVYKKFENHCLHFILRERAFYMLDSNC